METLFLTAVAFRIGSLAVHWYGIIITCAMCLGLLLAYKETEREHLSTDDLINIVLWLIPAAVIGARLYYVIFRWEFYSLYPEYILAVWKGGLAIHGGVLAGILVVFFYARKKKQRFLRWADIIAPSLILGQAIGRWGNFANAEAYGPVISDGSFWSWVPFQIMVDGVAHHPAFLYESIWDLLLFIALMVLIRKPHKVGSVFAWYLIGYSVGRFFIEILRTDSLMVGQLRTAMVASALLILVGVAIFWYLDKKPKVNVANMPEAVPDAKPVEVEAPGPEPAGDADTGEQAAETVDASADASIEEEAEKQEDAEESGKES